MLIRNFLEWERKCLVKWDYFIPKGKSSNEITDNFNRQRLENQTSHTDSRSTKFQEPRKRKCVVVVNHQQNKFIVDFVIHSFVKVPVYDLKALQSFVLMQHLNSLFIHRNQLEVMNVLYEYCVLKNLNFNHLLKYTQLTADLLSSLITVGGQYHVHWMKIFNYSMI